MKIYHYILILLAFSIFMFTFGLGNMPLTDPDESFYAATVREMTEDGEWITPTIFGKPQFEKPVLYYWLIRISYEVFGINEFSSRLPSAVFGVLGVIGIFYLGKMLFSPLCGFLSALITTTSIQYIVLSRACVTDMVLSVFILFSILFSLYGFAKKRSWYFYISSAVLGLAVLTKGPVAILIVVMTIGIYLLLTRQIHLLRKIPLLFSGIIFLGVVLPWYLAVYRIHGNTFINEFFGFHNITRFLVPEHRIGDSPFFYIPVILGGLLPWTVFVPVGIWEMYKSKKESSSIKSYKVLLAVWFLFTFLFFSISRTKLVTYIFPVFPVLSIVVGRFWEEYLTDAEKMKKLRKPVNIALVILFVGGLAGIVAGYLVLKYKGYTEVVQPVILCSIIFLLGIFFSLWAQFAHKKVTSFAGITLSTGLIVIPLTFMVLPVVGGYESSKEISIKLNEQMGKGEKLGGVCDQRRGLAFYTGRREIVNIQMQHDKVKFLNNENRVWGVVKNKHYEQINNKGLKNPPVRVYDHDGKVLFTNKPLEK